MPKLLVNLSEDLYQDIIYDEACGLNELTRAIAKGRVIDECALEDCVSREMAIEFVNGTWGELVNPTIDNYIESLKQLPSVTRPTSTWDYKPIRGYFCHTCSSCMKYKSNYCPDCGALML